MSDSKKIDEYINSLPEWQRQICSRARKLIFKLRLTLKKKLNLPIDLILLTKATYAPC
jgi:hypothetical protein